MPSILFLIADESSARNDNHVRLPAAFEQAGWTVHCTPHRSLAMAEGTLLCSAGVVTDFDRIWCLGFGAAATFFDRMQMLATIPSERFVTSVEALLLLHGKYRWQKLMPDSFVSDDAGYLLAQTGRGGDWIVKPPAGSFGRDVYLLAQKLSTARKEVLLRRAVAGGRYALLQRYVSEIAAGEKRVLFAGGLLLGSYLRRPAEISGAGDLRTPPLANRARGGSVAPTTLTPDETALAGRIADDLLALGVGFAAIDLVYPYLMEVNVANPGGLATLFELHGTDSSARVVQALIDLWH